MMRVFVLGLDGATWDVLRPLVEQGHLPRLARLMQQGAAGTSTRSVYPPLSPVAWTGVMTGKNSGKHGVFEFLEFDHDPLGGRVNSSRSIQAELVWEIAGRHGKVSVTGGVPLSYPPRPAPGFFLGDFLSPADAPDFASDPAALRRARTGRLDRIVPGPRPSMTAAARPRRSATDPDGLPRPAPPGRPISSWTAATWDLFMYNLMATDRIQHELWHTWDPHHPVALQGARRSCRPCATGSIAGSGGADSTTASAGAIADAALPADTMAIVLLMSDHGFRTDRLVCQLECLAARTRRARLARLGLCPTEALVL